MPIRLLCRHRREDDWSDDCRECADRQNPLCGQTWNEPCSDESSTGSADGDGGEAVGNGEGGPVADFLLPGDHVPDDGAVGHETKKDDDDEGEE